MALACPALSTSRGVELSKVNSLIPSVPVAKHMLNQFVTAIPDVIVALPLSMHGIRSPMKKLTAIKVKLYARTGVSLGERTLSFGDAELSVIATLGSYGLSCFV